MPIQCAPLVTFVLSGTKQTDSQSFNFCSDEVDEATALFIKTEVTDGIIAPGYSPEALEV